MPETTSSRSIWKGALSFGLVTIPVRLHTAVSEKSVKFNQLDSRDSARIKYKRVNAHSGEEVPWENIVRGYEFEPERYVIVTDDELQSTRGEKARTVDITAFVSEAEIDPLYYKGAYYLAPEETGTKAYRLLHTSLKESGRVALCRFTLREKENLAVVRPQEDVLVLETMYWPDEIREPRFEFMDTDTSVRDTEVDMARLLIDAMTTPFEPDQYNDTTREAVEDLIRRKVDGEDIAATPAAEVTGVADLMAALRASIEATKSRRDGGDADADVVEVGQARATRPRASRKPADSEGAERPAARGRKRAAS